LRTNVKVTWCPGCGNYSILNAFERAAKKLKGAKIVISSGIGCHGKITDYLRLPSIHVIHGRVPPFLTGLKLANPDLVVVGFVGDGDALNEGLDHLIHAARRNTDITVILHNNGVFALTTGQVTATSPKGFRGRSTPYGNPENPINPCSLMIMSGATFVAREFAGRISRLSEIIYRAMKHRGFSFVEVIQPCVSFNDTWHLREKIRDVERVESLKEALEICSDPMACGVIYERDEETFEEIISRIFFKYSQ